MMLLYPMESFINYLTCHESSILREAIMQSTSSLSKKMQSKLIDVLSRLGCTEIPTSSSIKRIIINIAT